MPNALLPAADRALAGHLEHLKAESLSLLHGRDVRRERDKLRPCPQRRSALAEDSGLAVRWPSGRTSVRRILVHQRMPVNAETRGFTAPRNGELVPKSSVERILSSLKVIRRVVPTRG